jgi:hypothetical protein
LAEVLVGILQPEQAVAAAGVVVTFLLPQVLAHQIRVLLEVMADQLLAGEVAVQRR